MKTKFFLVTAMVLGTIIFTSCSDDDDPTVKHGQLNVKITDAPSDDSNIQGTFVTVSKLMIDGHELEGFQKQTIDISAYQEGNSKLIFKDEMEAGSYSNVSLVINYETDMNENSPGCYILTTDNKKHNLTNSSDAEAELTLNKTFNVESSQTTDIVIDFDLRKSVVRNNESSESDYSFASDAELQSAVRIVTENETGVLEGEINNNTSLDLDFVVYVYKKGEYNFVTETQGQNSGEIMFANAITSTKVNEDGSYHLAFLEEGDYEIHVACYLPSTNNEKLSFAGMADAISLTPALLLDNLQISSNSTVELNISVNINI